MASQAWQFSAAGTVSWQAPFALAATSFANIAMTAGSKLAVISRDPNVSATTLATPASAGVDENILAMAAGSASPSICAFGLSAGERVFVSMTGAGTALLTFDPI